MKVFHPFDVMIAFTILVGALPLGAAANAGLWFAILIAVTLRARHGSVPVGLSSQRDRRGRTN